MSANILIHSQLGTLEDGISSFEEGAKAIFAEAQRAVALIPGDEFQEVYEAAPEMEFHHQYVQSLLTWIWYEIHENEVPLENLPEALADFFQKYEKPFAAYWK